MFAFNAPPEAAFMPILTACLGSGTASTIL